MNKNDHLFQLIKSLDKNEKRYFKLNSSHYGNEKQCIELFNCIDKQKEYDEEKLKKSIKNKQLIKRLAFNKHYLYNTLLKSLRPYSSGSTKEVFLKELLLDIGFLFQKRLFNRCLKLISKAKTIAYKYDKHLALLELIKWEKRVAENIMNFKTLTTCPFDEEKVILEKIYDQSKLEELSQKIFAIINKEGDFRSPLKLKVINNLLLSPSLKNQDRVLSHYGQFYFYNIHAICSRIKGNLKKSFEYHKKLVLHIESHPWQIEENGTHYITALTNFISICKMLRKHSEFTDTLNKMKKYPAKTTRSKIQIFERIYIHETDYYVQIGEPQKAVILAKEISQGMVLYKDQLSDIGELLLNCIMGYAFFGNGNFKESIKWLNKVLYFKDLNLRQDIQSSARIMNLISHFEIGNEDVLEYITKSTITFFNKKDRLLKLELVVLEFLKRIALEKHKNSRELLFKAFQKDVLNILKNPVEKQVLDNFDIISWLESKIENRPFAEIVKEKARKN